MRHFPLLPHTDMKYVQLTVMVERIAVCPVMHPDCHTRAFLHTRADPPQSHHATM